mmetsp:Transcript_25159/g.51118  ORF Transcript_25159/g.51118 Transcript_25159/m.51118 type:complete len:212 (-) Transcript_25159:67-702(-)
MLLLMPVALAPWTPRRAALAAQPARRSSPFVAASVAATKVRRADQGDRGGMERYGKDPRPELLQAGEPVAGWAVPSAGNLGQITSVPELTAALAAAQASSKLVVVKFFAPWCSSCKAIEARFARTARANADVADFYAVDFSACKPYCKASGIKFMPVAHIYADGALQDCLPLGAKVYSRFVKRLGTTSAGQISATSSAPANVDAGADADAG